MCVLICLFVEEKKYIKYNKYMVLSREYTNFYMQKVHAYVINNFRKDHIMSTYTDKIDAHVIYANLKNVEDELNAIEAIEGKAELAIETLARISMVIKNLRASMENCNKNLIAISWFEESSKALSNIKSYLSNYKSNKDANTLTNNTLSQIDILLHTSAKLNCVKSNQSLRGLINAQNEHTRFMDVHNEQLSEKIKLLEEDISALRNKVSEYENNAKNNLVEFQNTISSEKQRLDGFAISYQKQMNDDQKEFLEMNDLLKENFTLAQEERKKSFDTEIETIKKQNNKLVSEYTQKFDDYEQQVVNIVGIVNTNMFSHKYKEVADDAKKRSQNWHKLAMWLMVAVGGFAVYAFVLTVNSDTSWVKLVAKIFATTTLVTSAAYAARQASKQEKVERYARKIEMELVAIDPFIASLDADKQAVLKEELSRKIFGNIDGMEINSKDEAYTAMDKLISIESILKSLAGVINK